MMSKISTINDIPFSALLALMLSVKNIAIHNNRPNKKHTLHIEQIISEKHLEIRNSVPSKTSLNLKYNMNSKANK